MMGFFHSAFVIGRRDFTTTVFAKAFLFFLLTPLLIMGVSVLMGKTSGQMARDDLRSSIAIVASGADFREIEAARARLNPAFGREELPVLVHAEPAASQADQVKALLGSKEQRILAVLTGGLNQPTLTGDVGEQGTTKRQMQLILGDVRQQRALQSAGAVLPPLDVRVIKVDDSAASLATARALTARAGQFLLFLITVLLATMLLSNLVEEKSSKVIEVLAAAVPVDAIFIGKLFAMLAVSLVGVGVWLSAAVIALSLSPVGVSLPQPAVGWPLFLILLFFYYSTNYLLLGALFLGIGSQASSIREIQTLSMPVTIIQIAVFFLAFYAIGKLESPIGILAAVFPFSSPLTMVARAAELPELWPHLLALLWQFLWVWLTVKLSASLFRSNVMKSGAGGGASSFFRRRAKA